MSCAFGHRVAMCCDLLAVIGSSLKMVKTDPTTANRSQHIAIRWPNAHAQHVAPNNVGILCVGILRSFGRGFTTSTIDGLPVPRSSCWTGVRYKLAHLTVPAWASQALNVTVELSYTFPRTLKQYKFLAGVTYMRQIGRLVHWHFPPRWSGSNRTCCLLLPL